MKKHKKHLTILFIVSMFLSPIIAYASQGSFSLAYLGGTHTSNDVSISLDYPGVEFYNHNVNVDAELAVSVEKKGLLGYTFKERQQKWIKNGSYHAYMFGKHGSGTYRAVFVVNQINGSGYVSGEYNLFGYV